MPDHENIRTDLLDAMGHLKEAHTALLADDLRNAIINLETAQGALAEVRSQLPSGVPGYDNPKPASRGAAEPQSADRFKESGDICEKCERDYGYSGSDANGWNATCVHCGHVGYISKQRTRTKSLSS